MHVLKWRLAMLLCGALAALWRPVVRVCVRLAGRLSYWQDQAEIGWLLAITQRSIQNRKRGSRA